MLLAVVSYVSCVEVVYVKCKCCVVAPGETVTIAEEMAARDALRRLFKITESRAPLPFGQVVHKLQLADSEQRQ